MSDQNLQSLYTGDIPYKFPSGCIHNWDFLSTLWRDSRFGQSSITFDSNPVQWKISESINFLPAFSMERDKLSLRRDTKLDTYGLLGLSLVNLHDVSVILTEGVSDFFTAKLLCPSRNVLGVTTLGGSTVCKQILINLFNSFVICVDNDESGRNNAMNWKSFLKQFSKNVTFFFPDSSYKDISDNFVSLLKFNRQ